MLLEQGLDACFTSFPYVAFAGHKLCRSADPHGGQNGATLAN